jgi:diguanylate cyclase (GGDEF)-like protein/PAS domain S-box-containing protein
VNAPPTEKTWRVLVVHPDAKRASGIGQLLTRSGAAWERQGKLPSFIDPAIFDAIIIHERSFTDDENGSLANLREYIPGDAVLIGLVDSLGRRSSRFFGAGVDLIFYEPLVPADLERALAFTDAIRNETREQARDRLRKMTALHELAIASAYRTGFAGWLDQLIEAGCGILGADALAMWTIDRERSSFRCMGSVGLGDDYVRTAEEQSPSIVDFYDEVPNDLATHWLSSIHKRDRFRISAPDVVHEAPTERIAWLPVRDANNMLGHLSFYFMSEDAFEQYDLVLADAFASIVAAALGTFWLQSEIRRTNRLYREHVESSPNGVVVCLPDGTIERSNPAIEQITGRDTYEIIGESIFEWFPTPDALPWQEWSTRATDGPGRTVDLWLTKPSGERRRVSCYARRISFPDPRRIDATEHRVQVVLQDVTQSARRLVELELLHDLTRLISNRGSLDEAYQLVVSRLYNYLNYRLVTVGELVERDSLELQAFRTYMVGVEIPQVFDVADGLCGRAIRENRSILVRDVATDPDYISIDDEVLSEIVAVIRADGKPIGLIDIQTDSAQPLDESDLQLATSIAAHLGLLIQQVTIHERLEIQAMTDPLTGIANRRAFMQRLQSLVNDPNSPSVGLFLVELDHFKGINDRYGHLFGDEMLKQVANRLRQVLRENDLLARYGGDEIAMIFYDISPRQAMSIAQRLRSTVSDHPFSFNGTTVTLTVSIGISLFPYHGRTPDELIGEADRAMYAAKLDGRNRIRGSIPS